MRSVPVTPAVVSWAVDQAGFTVEEIADATGTTSASVAAWIKGTEQPSLSQARKLAKKLRRPLALLMWSSPPPDDTPEVAFRAPVADEIRDLNTVERRFIRQSARLQKVAGSLRGEIEDELPHLPALDRTKDASDAATRVRRILGVSVPDQIAWTSEFVAFRSWRAAFEKHGILVFTLPLGGDSCRGMTLADPTAPTIVINTHWNVRARIFTLFHELGHVLTGTTSACAASLKHSARGDSVERWCEEFAAAALMPWSAIEQHLTKQRISGSVDDLAVASSIARTFKVSLQAATLRLISGGRAKWTLWDQIPKDSNVKTGGGGAPEEPRTTPIIRIGELGRATVDLLVRGMKTDLIDRSQVASYLRVGDDALTEIERRISGPEGRRS
jgi:Zn-dependent peptidase ImmA (M78 family)/DNA-binding XRE family transcriptional regulator